LRASRPNVGRERRGGSGGRRRSPGSLPFAVDYLKEEYDVESVALVGASAGTGPVLQVAEEDPEEISQIIVLSDIGDVYELGEVPQALRDKRRRGGFRASAPDG
jgi:hypothetical protein